MEMSSTRGSGVFTIIPERKPLSNMRFSRRQVTLRPFTFVDPPKASPVQRKKKKPPDDGAIAHRPSEKTHNINPRRRPSKQTHNLGTQHNPSENTSDISTRRKASKNTLVVASRPQNKSIIQTGVNQDTGQDNFQHRKGSRLSTEDNDIESQNESSEQIVQDRDDNRLSSNDRDSDESDHDPANDVENRLLTLEPVRDSDESDPDPASDAENRHLPLEPVRDSDASDHDAASDAVSRLITLEPVTKQAPVLQLQLDVSDSVNPERDDNVILQPGNDTSMNRESHDLETRTDTNKDQDENDIDEDLHEASDVPVDSPLPHEASDVPVDSPLPHEASDVPIDNQSPDVSNVQVDTTSHNHGLKEMTNRVHVVETEGSQAGSSHSISDAQPKSVLRKGTKYANDGSQHRAKHKHTVKYSSNTKPEQRPRIDRQSTNEINQSSLSMIHDASVSIVMQAEDRSMPSVPGSQVAQSRVLSQPSQEPSSEPAKKHDKPKASSLPAQNVQMWCGGKRKRKATDVIDLDIILDVIEEVSFDYREELATKTQRNAVRGFFRTMQETITDTIDGVQEMKYLKSKITKSISEVNSNRRELLLLRKKQKQLRQKLSSRVPNKSSDLLSAEAWLQRARQLEAY